MKVVYGQLIILNGHLGAIRQSHHRQRHPDTVRGLLGRAEAAMNGSAKLRKEVEQLRREIQHQTRSTPSTRGKKHE